MIIVTGTVQATPGMADEALRIATAHVLRSRTEPGCISHAVHRDAEDPDRLFFFERWTDLAALKAHFAVPASGATVAALARVSAEPPAMTIYEATEQGQ